MVSVAYSGVGGVYSAHVRDNYVLLKKNNRIMCFRTCRTHDDAKKIARAWVEWGKDDDA